jgi:hypothetical protein
MLGSLALALPAGERTSPTAGRVSGQIGRLEKNDLGLESVSFEFKPDGCVLTLRDDQAGYPIAAGLGQWRRGETALPGTPPRLVSGGAPRKGTPSKVAASGAWRDPATFELVLRYYETPHHDTVTCRFDGSTVTIGFMSSIAAMSPAPKDKRPPLQGRLLG